MIRATLLIVALLSLRASAQQPPPHRLSVEPRAAPVPALKYFLLPELRDRQSGNAAQLYYRAFSPEWQGYRRDEKFLERVLDMAPKPLRDLRAADFAPLAPTLNSKMLQEVDRGARRTYCDWELLDRVREDGIGLLLPDLHTFREFANLLHLRARLELLEGRYDKAARTLQTGLATSRHVADGPTLIHGLVAVACASALLPAVEDWVERPGAPNLYWALTDLPRPFISLRTCLEGERLFVDNLFPGYRAMLDDVTAPPSSARVLTTMQQYARMLEFEGGERWGTMAYALRAYPAAKRFLRERGRAVEEIEKMPALQAVFLYEIHSYDVAYDDLRKWASLPYHEAAPHVSRAVHRTKAETARRERSTLASALLPALERILAATARVDRRIAALRCVEALRLHAAAYGGKWPTKFDEVTIVPIPVDPMTGRAFEYKREGNKAILASPASLGEATADAVRYELTLREEKN